MVPHLHLHLLLHQPTQVVVGRLVGQAMGRATLMDPVE